ncbi:hypothetical protein R3P38DRAFT_3563738 [Favolaschia claudopus]|uniref:NWD NACHT-NTPase N-terminal domain-containing protein n=1 Tax=Favolaschia claudopus TaxID=2862362 RepID=A0AAW0DQJ1_9AGAR
MSQAQHRQDWLNQIATMQGQLGELIGTDSSPGGLAFATQAAQMTSSIHTVLHTRVPRQPPPTQPAQQPPQKKSKKSQEEGTTQSDSRLLRREKAINTRVGAALASVTLPGISLETYLDYYTNGITTDRNAEREDLALRNVIRGYDCENKEAKTEWTTAVEALVEPEEATSEILEKWKANSAQDDVHLWLSKTHTVRFIAAILAISNLLQLLESHAIASRQTQLITHVIQAIGAIEFAQVWNKQPKGTKTKTYRHMFAELPAEREHFTGLDEKGISALVKGERKQAFHTFTGQMGLVNAARNKLAEAYQEFGPQIFLDPFWSPAELHANKRTEDWPRIFADVVKNPPHDPDADFKLAPGTLSQM